MSLPLVGVLPDTARITGASHLSVGGCDLVALAEKYGTPLYVYDEETIRARARAYREGLAEAYPGESLVCYACKAYCAPWLLRLLQDEGLGVDVVSGGELFVAQHAGFPIERVYFHGNNKGEDELRQAVEAGVGRIVVDNLEEIERLAGIARERSVHPKVLLRITPGVEAHTHEHIKTGILDTKFGMNIAAGSAEVAVRKLMAEPALDLVGLHAHIGSQIFEMEPYREAMLRLFAFAANMRDRYGMRLRQVSPGGGFGIRYTSADAPVSADEAARSVADAVAQAAREFGFDDPFPAVTIEPGRSIVGPAGVALYSVGSVKTIPGVRTYVAIDGGMADNIRPTTYGALYSALLANRADQAATTTVSIAGKYCESGDVLIRDAHLPEVRVGDIVAVPSSGAYHLSMANNYNLALRPPVVVVADGCDRLVHRRERYEDLLRCEVD